MAAEDMQLTLFTPEDSRKIVDSITSLKENVALVQFKELAKAINDSTGRLPVKTIPSLQRVAELYSVINSKVTVGLSQAGAVLNKFVIKSAKVVERGMSNADKAALVKMGNQLNCEFVTELQKFSDQSRDDLIDIYQSLLEHSCGDRLHSLMETRQTKQDEIVKSAGVIKGIANQIGILKGKIDSYNYDIEMSDKAIGDSDAMKQAAREELNKLKGQLPEYENAVQEHRDTHHVERGSFWIFSWKVRDVHVDNGERIARENLTALTGRIHCLSARLESWSTEEFEKRKKEAIKELPKCKETLKEDQAAYEVAQRKHEELEKEFNDIVADIEQIYKKSESRDAKSIAEIDKLARAIYAGSSALVAAFGTIRTHLESIDADSDLLVSSVMDALTILSIGDQYTGTNRIAAIRTVLSITN